MLTKFEILEVKSDGSNTIIGFKFLPIEIRNQISEGKIIYYKIHSIKRLHDGNIFTIGDHIKIENTESIGTINKLWIVFNKVKIFVGRLELVLYDNIKQVR